MPAILTTNFSVINAENFINSMSIVSGDDTSLSSNYYLAIGRGYHVSSSGTTTDAELKQYYLAGPTNNQVKVYDSEQTQTVACTPDEFKQWTIGSETSCTQCENNPPTPEDTEDSKNDFKNNIMMIKKIKSQDVAIVVPRVNWTAGDTYRVVDTTQNPGKRAKDYYVMNSNYEVWMLTGKGTGASATAIDEPMFTGTSSTFTGTGDNYTWQYMYKITQDYVNKGMLLDDWMPVPFKKFGIKDTTSTQYNYGDKEANRTLGAYRVLVSVKLSSEDNLQAGSIYRQIGIIADPRKNDATKSRLEVDSIIPASGTNTGYDRTSGELIYLENRKPIMRSDDQSETLELLVIF